MSGDTLPLSQSAKRILAGLPRIDDCKFVFTADGRKPLSGFSMFKEKFDRECGVAGWRIHDLRRTARSLLSRAGVNADIGERALGHSIRGIRGTYDRHSYESEMRDAFEAVRAAAEWIKNVSESGVELTLVTRSDDPEPLFIVKASIEISPMATRKPSR